MANVIVLGWIEFEPGDRDRWLAEVGELVSATNDELGCHRYVVLPDPTTPTRVYFDERYDDDDALEAHLESDHIATFRAATVDCQVRDRLVEKFAATPID